MATVPNGVETLPKISIALVRCTNVTDDRQTDVRWHIANVNVSSPSLISIFQHMTNKKTCTDDFLSAGPALHISLLWGHCAAKRSIIHRVAERESHRKPEDAARKWPHWRHRETKWIIWDSHVSRCDMLLLSQNRLVDSVDFYLTPSGVTRGEAGGGADRPVWHPPGVTPDLKLFLVAEFRKNTG